MKKTKRIANGYTKWALVSDRHGNDNIDDFWYSSGLQPWLIGDEDKVAEDIKDWNNTKLRNFSKRLNIHMLNVISDEDETTYVILPVYSYKLTRSENKKLVDAYLETFEFSPDNFMKYHRKDLIALLGIKTYNKIVYKYKNND